TILSLHTLPLLTHIPISHILSFFFTHPATTAIYTLSLHDALPICAAISTQPPLSLQHAEFALQPRPHGAAGGGRHGAAPGRFLRSEEHTSELQSLAYLVCRLLLEKKKKYIALPLLSRPT